MMKAGASYVFSRYGKEYDTPATRLLFVGTLGQLGRYVSTLAHTFDNKL
jgi:hypothetical protein